MLLSFSAVDCHQRLENRSTLDYASVEVTSHDYATKDGTLDLSGADSRVAVRTGDCLLNGPLTHLKGSCSVDHVWNRIRGHG